MEFHQRLSVSGDVGVYYWILYSFSLCLKFAVRKIHLTISFTSTTAFLKSVFVVINKYLPFCFDSFVDSISCMYFDSVINFATFSTSFFLCNYRDEGILILNDRFVYIPVSDTLDSIWNKLDGWMVCGLRCLVYDAFQGGCVFGGCSNFVYVCRNSIVSCS